MRPGFTVCVDRLRLGLSCVLLSSFLIDDIKHLDRWYWLVVDYGLLAWYALTAWYSIVLWTHAAVVWFMDWKRGLS